MESEEAYKQALEIGDYKEVHKLAARIMHYSPETVQETKDMLDLLGVLDRCKSRGRRTRLLWLNLGNLML